MFRSTASPLGPVLPPLALTAPQGSVELPSIHTLRLSGVHALGPAPVQHVDKYGLMRHRMVKLLRQLEKERKVYLSIKDTASDPLELKDIACVNFLGATFQEVVLPRLEPWTTNEKLRELREEAVRQMFRTVSLVPPVTPQRTKLGWRNATMLLFDPVLQQVQDARYARQLEQQRAKRQRTALQ